MDGLKPDVNAFAVPLSTIKGNRYAPRQITSHRPWSQTHVQPLFGHRLDVRLPHRLLLLGVCFQRFLKEVKAVKQVVGFSDFDACVRVHLRNGVLEFNGFVGGTAGIALITPRTVFTASRAGPLNVAVGQKTTGTIGVNFVVLFGCLSFKKASSFKGVEIFLHHALVLFIAGPIKQSPTEFWPASINAVGPTAPEVQERLHVDVVVLVDDGLGRDTLRLSRYRNRCAVLVRTGHHQHAVSHGALKPVLNVRRQVTASDVAQMKRTVGVRPCNANQDMFT